MNLTLKSIQYLAILSIVLPNAFASNCGLLIGDRDKNDTKRHRRMVSVSLTPEDCQDSEDISINVPHNGGITTKSFHKVKSLSRQDNLLNGPKVASPNIDFNYGYWYGEDSTDGSTFNYVQDANGNISGSMVDLSSHTVMQFHIEDGVPVVIITDSSAFPDEIDPVDDDENAINDRSLSTTTTSLSNSSSSHQSTVLNSKDGLRINGFSLKDEISETKVNSSRSLYDDDGGNLDVMVVWTKEAECRNNGQDVNCGVSQASFDAMMARVNLAIEETNTAYDLSGVDTELLLVHAYRHPTYVDEGFSGSLSSLKSGSISGVHSNRETHGADIVALIIDDSQYCGIAYVGPSKDFMFSVTAWNCATGYYSFGHEIGHNLGLLHDRGTSNACNGQNYNYGYRDPQAQFRSILAYSCRTGQCDNNSSNGCTRVMRFSNPNNLYNGRPIGTATEDNARKVNDVRVQVAGYLRHGGTGSPPTQSPTSFPSSASPTSTPTQSPTSFPSSASPTSTPTACKDSPLKFKVTISPNKIKLKDCAWVENDTNTRCDYRGVSRTCRLTCGKCSKCADSPLEFKIKINAIMKKKRCTWAATNTSNRCNRFGVKETCPLSCQLCAA